MFLVFQRITTQDKRHSESSLIYNELERNTNELIRHGHEFQSDSVKRNLKENEMFESILCVHCEKLEITADFIRQR